MAKVLDFGLILILVAVLAASALYKLILSFRYRNDPAKREALISCGQVYPKRLARFIFSEGPAASRAKPSPPNPDRT